MYTIELDISHEVPSNEVHEFATEHGCMAELLQEYGPAGGNPLYKFSSEKFNKLKELAEYVFDGAGFDEEEIKTMIVEV